ncbi:MAG: DUF2931 family protein [Lentisphaeraceae bacterium]|nr:DUF2931 family protein [Lentisphaeraceae bacterium]
MIKVTVAALLLVGIIIFFTGCASKKYEWLATECAPKNYPMQIISGAFICPNGYVQELPLNKIISNGWGTRVSTHIVGSKFKPLPSKLEITWFSFTEDKFYSGEFELPLEVIRTLMKQGYVDHTGNEQKKEIFNRFMAGVAPGGHVSVWLAGSSDSRAIANFKAKEIDVPWKTVLDNPSVTRKDYIKLILSKDVAEALTPLESPIVRWQEYERQYKWKLKFETPQEMESVFINSLNGERRFLNYQSKHPLNLQKLTYDIHAVPENIRYVFETTDKKRYSIKIYFDHQKVFKAFKEFEAESEEFKLEVKFESWKGKPQITLVNGDKMMKITDFSIKKNSLAGK